MYENASKHMHNENREIQRYKRGTQHKHKRTLAHADAHTHTHIHPEGQ